MVEEDDVPPNVTFAYAVGDHVVSDLFAGVAVIIQIAKTKSRTDANDKACSIIYLKREHKHVPMDPQYIYSNDPFTLYATESKRAEQQPGAAPAGRPRRRTAAAIAAEAQAKAVVDEATTRAEKRRRQLQEESHAAEAAADAAATSNKAAAKPPRPRTMPLEYIPGTKENRAKQEETRKRIIAEEEAKAARIKAHVLGRGRKTTGAYRAAPAEAAQKKAAVVERDQAKQDDEEFRAQVAHERFLRAEAARVDADVRAKAAQQHPELHAQTVTAASAPSTAAPSRSPSPPPPAAGTDAVLEPEDAGAAADGDRASFATDTHGQNTPPSGEEKPGAIRLKIMSVSGKKYIHDGYLPAPTAEQLAAAAAKVAAGDGRAATQQGQVGSLRAASAAAPEGGEGTVGDRDMQVDHDDLVGALAAAAAVITEAPAPAVTLAGGGGEEEEEETPAQPPAPAANPAGIAVSDAAAAEAEAPPPPDVDMTASADHVTLAELEITVPPFAGDANGDNFWDRDFVALRRDASEGKSSKRYKTINQGGTVLVPIHPSTTDLLTVDVTLTFEHVTSTATKAHIAKAHYQRHNRVGRSEGDYVRVLPDCEGGGPSFGKLVLLLKDTGTAITPGWRALVMLPMRNATEAGLGAAFVCVNLSAIDESTRSNVAQCGLFPGNNDADRAAAIGAWETDRARAREINEWLASPIRLHDGNCYDLLKSGKQKKRLIGEQAAQEAAAAAAAAAAAMEAIDDDDDDDGTEAAGADADADDDDDDEEVTAANEEKRKRAKPTRAPRPPRKSSRRNQPPFPPGGLAARGHAANAKHGTVRMARPRRQRRFDGYAIRPQRPPHAVLTGARPAGLTGVVTSGIDGDDDNGRHGDEDRGRGRCLAGGGGELDHASGNQSRTF